MKTDGNGEDKSGGEELDMNQLTRSLCDLFFRSMTTSKA